MSLQADFLINNYGFKFEFDVCVNVRSIKEGKDIEERVLAHRLVLSSASVRFRGLLAVHLEGSVSSIDIDLRMIPNAVNAFKVMLSALYTGELNYTLAEPSEVLAVARACQVPTIESKVLATSLEINPLAVLIQQQKTPLVTESTPWQTYLQALLALYMQPGMFPNTFASGLAYPALFQTPPTPPAEESGSRSLSDGRSDGSSPRTTTPADNEKIVPSDDKEGWCRNKKYIEKVENGFMCTVCRKIYGRYNSVSYHVTIYHRNPPIRCDEAGCQFSTREARYIHFHKYYRHHIPLPDSIDLGSRKCPFCRHVSKSPAMLEKHIARHVPEKKEKAVEVFNCDQCIYRGKTASLLSRHKQFAHSDDLFSRRIKCSLCPFASVSQHSLILHIASVHSPTESTQVKSE